VEVPDLGTLLKSRSSTVDCRTSPPEIIDILRTSRDPDPERLQIGNSPQRIIARPVTT
jgi:hypothetical protein